LFKMQFASHLLKKKKGIRISSAQNKVLGSQRGQLLSAGKKDRQK